LEEIREDVWKKRRIEKMIEFQEVFQKIEFIKVGEFECEILPILASEVTKETAKAFCQVNFQHFLFCH